MKVSDLMYCYGAGVSYHIYQKPYMTKLIDCGVTTFNALLGHIRLLIDMVRNARTIAIH